MKKAELIKIINEKFNDLDSILIEELSEIFNQDNEQLRNEALLRAMHSEQFEVDFKIPLEKVIRDLAVWTTQKIFRSGTIEDLHAGEYSFEDYENIPPNTPVEQISQLTDDNMMILNKELVDKIGFMFTLFSRAEYFKFANFISGYRLYGTEWDKPNIEVVESNYYNYLLLITGMEKYLDK
ncbi:hypothetical protein M3152_16660 [Sporosarcina luteola]|uniref:hypothetical protein n=1 Tax=Sporosarcina luteola TaxID=582850 RepID=UPI00203B0F2E|nr:hypothetical protein [Sporosarcina luteola]MCM3639332.1 hypothetical protein [Sporosarcina luteola]